MRRGEKAKAVGRFVLANLDVVSVIGLAAVVLVVEAAGSPSADFVNAAILALLGLTAIILLRDRQGRARIDEIASLVEDLRSDRPYQVQAEVNQWRTARGSGRLRSTTSA